MSLDNLRNDLVQGALIDYLQTKANVTSLLSSAEEIKKNQWQGREFSYPNIRLRLISNRPSGNCEGTRNITLSWEVRSQEASSAKADMICGKIEVEMFDTSFSQNGLTFSLITTDNVPAIREDTTTWRSELLMRGTVDG